MRALRAYYGATVRLYGWQWALAAWGGFEAGYPNVLGFMAVLVLVLASGPAAFAATDPNPGTGEAIDGAKLSQAAYAAAAFIGALCTLPSVWAQTAQVRGAFSNTDITVILISSLQLAGHAARVAEALRALAALSSGDGSGQQPAIAVSDDGSVSIAATVVPAPLLAPTSAGPAAVSASRWPLRAPAVSLAPGQHLLVCGPVGAGKTSLLRAWAGLAHGASRSVGDDINAGGGSGSTKRPRWMFVPQQPYLPFGSLRDLLVFPAATGRSATGAAESDGPSRMDVLLTAAGASSASQRQLSNVTRKLWRRQPRRSHKCQSGAGVLEKVNAALMPCPYADPSLSPRHVVRYPPIRGNTQVSPSNSGNVGTYQMLSSDEAASDNQPPSTDHDFSDARLTRVLYSLGLGRLTKEVDPVGRSGLDAVLPWSAVLSGGEAQRVAFARLLVHRPLAALLDDATTAMDEGPETLAGSEAHALGLLRAAGITYISAGHRASLRRPHHHRLVMQLIEGQQVLRVERLGESETAPTPSHPASQATAFESPTRMPGELSSFPAASTPTISCVAMPTEETASLLQPMLLKGDVNSDPRVSSCTAGPFGNGFWSSLSIVMRLGFLDSIPPSLASVPLQQWPSKPWRRLDALGRAPIWACAVVAVGLGIGMSYVTVRVAAVQGDLFAAVLAVAEGTGAAASAWGLLAAATALYILSPAAGAAARTAGKLAAVRWHARLVASLTRRYLNCSDNADDSAVKPDIIGGHLRLLPPSLQPSSSSSLYEVVRPAPLAYAMEWNSAACEEAEGDAASATAADGSPDGAGKSTDRTDQRLIADTASMSAALGTVLFGGEGRLSLLQILATIASTTAAAAAVGGAWPVLICYAYTLVGLLVARSLARRVARLTALVALLEGVFRSVHSRVRAAAESIAAWRGEAAEGAAARAVFAGLMAVSVAELGVELPSRLSNALWAQAGTVLAYALAALLPPTQAGSAAIDTAALFTLANLLISLNIYLCSVSQVLS